MAKGRRAGALRAFGLKLDVDAIAIAGDLHAEANGLGLSAIGRAMKREGIRALALAGDLFHRLHRPLGRAELVGALKATLRRLELPREAAVVYTPALFGHDPIIDEAMGLELEGVRVYVAPGAARVELAGRRRLYVAHGDCIAHNGLLAGAAELAALTLARCPLLELLLRRTLGASADEWVFMGHTHLPLLDEARRVANPGAWYAPPFYWARGRLLLVKCVKNGLRVEQLRPA
jgi:predicted phosphodiesterase